VDLWAAIAAGAAGGLIVEVVNMWRLLAAWQAERHEFRMKDKEPLPKLTAKYIDIPADSLALIARLALGAIAGGLLHEQVTGLLAAIMTGAAAPAILLQLGTAKTVAGALNKAEEMTLPAADAIVSPIDPPDGGHR
jgi:hypothetical protein